MWVAKAGSYHYLHDTPTSPGALYSRYITDAPKNFAFKCHRVREPDGAGTVAYPVNAVRWRPGHPDQFATAGADGSVAVWDAARRRNVAKVPRADTSVADVDWNHDGSLFAIAVSYTYEQGEREHAPDALRVMASPAP